MSFSASTCLSYLNNRTLGLTLKVYTNPTSTTNPGTFLSDVSTSSVTGGNCPYTFVVPNGTTSIRLFDQQTNCYADIPVSDNNVCTTCDLDFTSISDEQISTIYVGNLTGSCDTVINNYRIGWYGPDSTTTLAFTSGKGEIWNYDAEHPITENSLDAPFLLTGEYVSKITDVELNGARLSYTGGTNQVISPSLINCTTNTTVVSYNCGNGSTSNFPYAHAKTYQSIGNTIPKSLSAEFVLSANTPYFMWSFTGASIYDTLKLDFSGSSYPVPINLEYVKVGSDVGNSFNPNVFPKSFNSTILRKITVLTGLTVNDGDSLIINVTPNPVENSTNWGYKFGCLSNQTTPNKTCLDSYKNRPYKIKKSSITGTTGDCNTMSVNFDVSGCTESENYAFINSPLVQNSIYSSGFNFSNTDDITKLLNLNYNTLTFGNSTITPNYTSFTGYSCTNSGPNTISVDKTIDGFSFEFSNIIDLSVFYNSFIKYSNLVKALTPTFVDDDTQLSYYKIVRLRIATNTGDVSCGDNYTYADYYVHCNSNVTTGTTGGGGFTMSVPTPLIVDNYVCPTCVQNCSNVSQYVNNMNSTRNTTFPEITNTSGLRMIEPFHLGENLYVASPTFISAQTRNGNTYILYTYNTNTYAASGTGISYTLIPSLSGSTWDWENHYYLQSGSYWYQNLYDYRVEVTSTVGNPFTFKIYAKQISNFQAIGSYIEVYDSTNPSGSDPVYVY
jgi:hypothetical protein